MEEYIATTLKGLENVVIEEIKNIIKVKSEKILDGRILFKTDKVEKLIEKTRTIISVYKLIKHTKFKTEKDILKSIEKEDFSFIKKDFVVKCKRKGDHKFVSADIERGLGGFLFNKGYKVNLKSPATIIYVEIINNEGLVGNLLAENLCKRKYRVKINSASINACLAAAMIQLSDVKKTDVILDPFCREGLIPIESAIAGVKKAYGFDENLHSIKSGRLNSKVAKVNNVEFSNYNLAWLDTALKKKSIDKVICYIPSISKRNDEKSIKKLYTTFFYQIGFILKKGGLIAVCVLKPELIKKTGEENKFKVIKKIEVSSGESVYYVLLLKKSI